MTLPAWTCFKGLWKRATERLGDRGEWIVGTAAIERQLLPFHEQTTINQTITLEWVGDETGWICQEPLANPCRLTRPQVSHSRLVVRRRAAPQGRHRAQSSQHRNDTNRTTRCLYKEPEYTLVFIYTGRNLLALIPPGPSKILQHRSHSAGGHTRIKALPTAPPMTLCMILLALLDRGVHSRRQTAPSQGPPSSFYGVGSAAAMNTDNFHEPLVVSTQPSSCHFLQSRILLRCRDRSG